MITIDFHAYEGTAVVAKYDDFCNLKLTERGDTINLYFEPQDFDKAEQIAKILNEAFEGRRAYAAGGFRRPSEIDPAALQAAE